MEQVLAVVSINLLAVIWFRMERYFWSIDVQTPVQVRMMFFGACVLGLSSALLTFLIGGDAVIRAWYSGATMMLGGLMIITIPGCRQHLAITVTATIVITALVSCSDLILSGAKLVPNSFSSSGYIITRVPGPFYLAWLAVALASILGQLWSLVVRSFTGDDSKDQNSAVILLCSLSLSYCCAIYLIYTMSQPAPTVNATIIMPTAFLMFCAGAAYTERLGLLVPVHLFALRRDLGRLEAIDKIASQNIAPVEIQKQLTPHMRGAASTYVRIGNNLVNLGDLSRYYWCVEAAERAESILSKHTLPTGIDFTTSRSESKCNLHSK